MSAPAQSAASAARPACVARRPRAVHELVAVALGGSIGASLRHATSIATTSLALDGALATAAVNVIGAFALGALLARATQVMADPVFRSFWVVGVCGSFTTFSTLASEAHHLGASAGGGFAVLHLAGSIFIGMAAFVLGQWLCGPAR